MIFSMSMCLDTVSNVLFMSMAGSSVRTGLSWLKPTRIRSVSSVKRVEVEYVGRKPCWKGDTGIWGAMRSKINFSKTLEIVESREMGL